MDIKFDYNKNIIDTISKVVEIINTNLLCLGFDKIKVFMPTRENEKYDCQFEIGNCVRFAVVKKYTNIPYMIKDIEQLKQDNFILIADYLNQSTCEKLIKANVEYADTAGNIFIKLNGQVILIKNCEKPKTIEQNNFKGRAWTLVGLKVLFLLLTENDALNWTYRKIAEYSGVSLGAIRYILADLENQNFIIKLDGKYEWLDKNKIIEQWVNLYQLKILPKLYKKKYLGTIPEDIDKYPLLIGGETFCDKQNIIKTNKSLFYSFDNINECIARNRWKESIDGDIEIRETFWPIARNMQKEVPYLLIYADLIAENDSRCTDAALEIYHRYLEE